MTDEQVVWPPTGEDDPAQLVEIGELWRMIQEVVRELPSDERRFATLLLIERRSLLDTTRRLGLSRWEGKQMHRRVTTAVARMLGSAYAHRRNG